MFSSRLEALLHEVLSELRALRREVSELRLSEAALSDMQEQEVHRERIVEGIEIRFLEQHNRRCVSCGHQERMHKPTGCRFRGKTCDCVTYVRAEQLTLEGYRTKHGFSLLSRSESRLCGGCNHAPHSHKNGACRVGRCRALPGLCLDGVEP